VKAAKVMKYLCCNRNFKTSKALLKRQTHQGWSREAQVRFPEGQEGTE